MYKMVKTCYLKGKIDAETGLTNAVKRGWITEEQKQELIELKKAMQQEQQKNEEEHKEGQEETL